MELLIVAATNEGPSDGVKRAGPVGAAVREGGAVAFGVALAALGETS